MAMAISRKVWWILALLFALGIAWMFTQGGVERIWSSEAGALPPSFVMEGSLTAVDLAGPAPSVVVAGKSGEMKLAVDPQETVVLQGGRVTTLGQLEKGQRVKARYAHQEGRIVIRSIEITDPLPVPAAATKDEPPAPAETTQPEPPSSGGK